MKVLSVNYPKQKEDLDKLERLTLSYDKKFKEKVNSEIERSKIPDFDLLAKRQFKASLCRQLSILWGRNTLFSLREPQVIFAQFGAGIFNGLLMDAVF